MLVSDIRCISLFRSSSIMQCCKQGSFSKNMKIKRIYDESYIMKIWIEWIIIESNKILHASPSHVSRHRYDFTQIIIWSQKIKYCLYGYILDYKVWIVSTRHCLMSSTDGRDDLHFPELSNLFQSSHMTGHRSGTAWDWDNWVCTSTPLLHGHGPQPPQPG